MNKISILFLAIFILLFECVISFAANVKLEKIVVTPSRYESDENDVDKSVTVIDSYQIAASNAKSVPDLLKGETGLEVKNILSNGKAAIVDLRGYGESAPMNTLVLINGRRTNQIDLSGTDWSQVNIDSIDRIEIVRGPQSVLYGDNAVGGVINIITKSGAGKAPGAGFIYRGGSYDSQEYNASIEGGTNFLDYYAGINQSSTDGRRVNNDLETIDFNSSITAKPAGWFKIKADAGYHKDWYGQPGALSASNLNAIGRDGSTSPYDRAKTEDYFITAAPEATYSSKSGTARIWGDVIVRDRKTGSLFNYTGGTTQRSDNIRTFGFTPKVSVENNILSFFNKFMLGIDYYANKDIITSTSASALTKVFIEKRTIGTYATDNLDITPELSINGGGRIEWARFKFDQDETTKMLSKKEMTEYAIEAGINYKFAERSSIYARYSRSFRFPAVDEWFSSDYVYAGFLIPGQGLNSDLVPQTGNHCEVGIKQALLKYLNINADYFFDYIKHELYFNPITYVNSVYDTTVRTGMELEAHLRPVDDLDLFTKYTYERAFFYGGQFAGDEIPGVPNNKIACGIDYNFHDCVRLHYLCNVTGSQFFISDQTNRMPRLKLYTVHDLKLSYYKYGFSAYIALYNILNEKYSSYGALYGSEPYYFTSPGRNVTLGVEYKF